jgi:hypothetical protein
MSPPPSTSTPQPQLQAPPALTRRKTFKSWTDGYNSLANALLVASTFAGTITFSIIFSAPRDASKERDAVYEPLAYASSLFLGSAIGCISILVSCRAGQTDDRRGDWWRVVAQVSFVVVGFSLIAAFGLLLGSLRAFGYRGPFILGVVWFVGFVIMPLVIGSFMIGRHVFRWLQ